MGDNGHLVVSSPGGDGRGERVEEDSVRKCSTSSRPAYAWSRYIDLTIEDPLRDLTGDAADLDRRNGDGHHPGARRRVSQVVQHNWRTVIPSPRRATTSVILGTTRRIVTVHPNRGAAVTPSARRRRAWPRAGVHHRRDVAAMPVTAVSQHHHSDVTSRHVRQWRTPY